MTNDELIAEFVLKLEAFNCLYDAHLIPRRAIQNKFNDVLALEWSRTQSRKNFSFAKAREVLPNYDELIKPFMEQSNELQKAQAIERQQKREELSALAEKIQVTAAHKIDEKANWSLYGSRSTSDFSTQGFGAAKYAKSAAEDMVDHIRACGVEAEIREDRREPTVSCGWSMESVTYNVYVNCSKTICEIVERKPGLSLRDWVKAQWARGVNPRVKNPMLPAGYEASVGLDYFGRDIQKAVTV